MNPADTPVGRLIAAVEADGHTGHIGTRQFRDCRVCQALTGLLSGTSTGCYLPNRYWDGITDTTLDTAVYPYGNNQPGTGVQVTMQHDENTLAVRLPGPVARTLALSIIGSLDQPPPREPR